MTQTAKPSVQHPGLKPNKLGLTRRDLAGYAVVEAWQKGWKDGLQAYRKIWKSWK